MHVSVEDSLKKLRTTYIDILYVHWVGTNLPVHQCYTVADIQHAVGLGQRCRGGHEWPAQPRRLWQGPVPGESMYLSA